MRKKVMSIIISAMMVVSISASLAQNVGEQSSSGTQGLPLSNNSPPNPQNVVQSSSSLGGSGGLADSPWPMFRHDTRHTGQSPYDTSTNPGKIKWSFTTGLGVGESAAIGSDGMIYFTSSDGKLYAINHDGTENWSFVTGAGSSPAIDSQGVIYTGTYYNEFYAINPNGTEKWSITTGGRVYSAPAVGSDGTIYIGSRDSKLYAINPDGTEKWSFDTGSYVDSSPAIGSDGTIYIGSCGNHKLHAINPDGTKKWSFTAGGGIYSSPAIGSDGTIYVGSDDNKLYAIYSNGAQKWSFTTGERVYSSPAIGSDGTIYVGSADDKLYAINPDGTEKWNFMTGHDVDSSPSIGSDGTIYVGSEGDGLWAINPDGTEKWNCNIGIVLSSPAIDSDGTIYVGSVSTYKLYAIGTPTQIQPPIADPGPNQTVKEGDIIQFDASASYDPDGTIETYEWDFDASDGLWWETGAVPDATGPTPTHIYGDDGEYIVTLRVTDDTGLDDTDNCSVKVKNVAPTVEENFTQEVKEEWIRRYFQTSNGLDHGYRIEVGPKGNIYVAGDSRGYGTGIDYVVIKYDSNGNELWVARYNGPENIDDWMTDMIVDSLGNVFVTGYTDEEQDIGSRDYNTVAFDSNGNQLWAASYDGPLNSHDEAWAITVDPYGKVYVTGFSRGENPYSIDIATIAYDSLGNQLWVTRSWLADEADFAYDIAVDTSGNVYVTGCVQGLTPWKDHDYLTIAYNSTGNQLWSKRYNGPGDAYDWALSINIGPEGNIYITGRSNGGYYTGETNDDYATIAYDSDGNELWLARYNGPGNLYDTARDLAIDNNGNVFVLGYSQSIEIYSDMALVAYDSSGNQLWVVRYNGPANNSDYDGDLTIGPLGNIYITGWSHNGKNYDYLTAAYSPLGNELWTARYNGPIDSLDYPYGIAVDASGNVYVTGKSHVTGPYGIKEERYDIVTIKYSPPASFVYEEGSPISFTNNASDPGSDDLTFIWNWGDGTPDTVTTYYNDGIGPEPVYDPTTNEIKSPWGTYPFSVTDTISHIYGDDGVFTVTLTVIDDDGGMSVYKTNITVTNVNPTVTIEAITMDVEIGLRVAGRKYNNVSMTLYEEGNSIGYVSIERMPGSPNEQMAWIPVSINFSKSYSATVIYNPKDPPNVGANPVWIYLKSKDGTIKKIHHTFNVQQSKKRDSDHWNHVEPWEVDLSAHFIGLPFEISSHITDPGSDDETLTFTYGSQVVTITYLNNPPNPDPYPSPEVKPMDITDTITLVYEGSGTVTLVVKDDDNIRLGVGQGSDSFSVL